MRKAHIPSLRFVPIHGAQHLVKHPIGQLSLAISLWVISAAVFERSPKFSPQCYPKMAKEFGVLVGSDGFRNTM